MAASSVPSRLRLARAAVAGHTRLDLDWQLDGGCGEPLVTVAGDHRHAEMQRFQLGSGEREQLRGDPLAQRAGEAALAVDRHAAIRRHPCRQPTAVWRIESSA
jgi:hypothetical protein